jgi:ABC-type multidrug transport system fused ATPase/permease subunit
LKNSPIVVIDEATSSMDKKNEEIIDKVMRETFKEKTTFVIAHKVESLLSLD